MNSIMCFTRTLNKHARKNALLICNRTQCSLFFRRQVYPLELVVLCVCGFLTDVLIPKPRRIGILSVQSPAAAKLQCQRIIADESVASRVDILIRSHAGADNLHTHTRARWNRVRNGGKIMPLWQRCIAGVLIHNSGGELFAPRQLSWNEHHSNSRCTFRLLYQVA